MTLAVVDIQKGFEGAIAAFADQPDCGLMAVPHPKTIASRQLVSALAARYRTPTIYPYRYFARDGGLVAYGPDQFDQRRGAATYVDHILKGAKPASDRVRPALMPIQRQRQSCCRFAIANGKTMHFVCDIFYI